MSRYFYYVTFINTVATMSASMPRILLLDREGGAIVSLLLSIPIGLIVCYGIGRFFQEFPGKGLPELMDAYIPKFFKIVLLLGVGIVWYAAGLLSLINYSFFIKRFLSPNANLIYIVSLILLFIYYGALMKSKNILYVLEMIFIFTVPLIFLIVIKGFTSEHFEVDFVKESLMHIKNYPSYHTICAAAFVFWGPANLIIFNRVMRKKQSMTWKSICILGLFGTSVIFASYFGPIGLLGFENIGSITYPGVTTTDALQIKYWIIERVIFLSLMLYLAITFGSLLTHWHVALELFKSVIYFKKLKWKKHNLTPHLFLILFWIMSVKVVTYLTEYQLLKYTGYFYNLFPPLLIIMFLQFWLIKRKAKA